MYGPDKPPALAAGDVLVSGHTHIPVAEVRDQIGYFNPGSVSIPKGGFPASYGMLDDDVLTIYGLADSKVIADVAITP